MRQREFGTPRQVNDCVPSWATQIVTSSDDGTERVWDAETGVRLCTLGNYTPRIVTAAFSPDGTKIKTGERLCTLVGHADRVRMATFSPDGRFMVTGSDDHTAKVWDVHL